MEIDCRTVSSILANLLHISFASVVYRVVIIDLIVPNVLRSFVRNRLLFMGEGVGQRELNCYCC